MKINKKNYCADQPKRRLNSHARALTITAISVLGLLLSNAAVAQEILYVYGPGGPAPAMKEAAAVFEKLHDTKVEVVAGPTPTWIAKAKQNADVIYSGSETMMTDFTVAMDGRIVEQTIEPLYLRPLAILVRKNNPKHISGVNDLLKPGVKILVVNGAGQNGVWEDMAGRKGDINTVRNMRSHIVSYAGNSAIAKQTWIDHPEIDVWLIWNIWQVANPTLADVIPIEPDYAIYRDTGVGLTVQGTGKPVAKAFVEFLHTPKAAQIFKKWGWSGS
ncbi:substrate-binding domain-containing protein [Glaciimonas soli]|uniref:ABC transporter substrate-binding protein n=1 Tax=Glaciimonas soli TaxID=2590999 RepID=A0A843YRM8_9BURK|nr:substrate-binding domain-containing protein [Glaciimonas soli]MQR02409.1 ABC transporter substrate-binding protein [Glaciimonas soli]